MSEYIEGEQVYEGAPYEEGSYQEGAYEESYFDENGQLLEYRFGKKSFDQAREIIDTLGDNILVDEQIRHCARLNNILISSVAAIDPSPMGAGKTRCSLITAYLLGYRKIMVIGTVNGEEAFYRENRNLRLGLEIAYFTFEKFTGRKVKGKHKVDHDYLKSTSTFETKKGGRVEEKVTFWFPLDPDYLDTIDDDDERQRLIDDTYYVMGDRFIIIDEIHKAKNESKRSSAIKAFLSGITSIVEAEGAPDYEGELLGSRILLLSGTPYSKVISASKYLSFLSILPPGESKAEYSREDLLYGLNTGGDSLSRVATVAIKGINIEEAVADGRVDTQVREVIMGTTEELFKRYISGGGMESVKYALTLKDKKNQKAASDEAVNNFYHEVFSMVFLPVLGDSMQLSDLGMVTQNKYNLIIPLVRWREGNNDYSFEDRISRMNYLVDKFNQIAAGVGRIYTLGDLVNIRIKIHDEMMPDVLKAVYKHLDKYPTSKCVIFLPFTHQTFTNDDDVITFITTLPRPHEDPDNRRHIISEEERLIGRMRKIIRIDGTVKGSDRVRLIDDFNANNNDYRVAIVGLGAGSETISLDDKFGDRPRFSFILLDYNTINIHQAALRTQRLSTRSVGSIYLVHPLADEDTVSLISIIGASSPVIRFATLSPESETPGDYPIAIGWPEYVLNEVGVYQGVLPLDYPSVRTAYQDLGFIESIRNGTFAYQAYLKRNPSSRMTLEEYQSTFSGLRGAVATAVDADEEESTLKPKVEKEIIPTSRVAPAERPISTPAGRPRTSIAPKIPPSRTVGVVRGAVSRPPPTPSNTNVPTTSTRQPLVPPTQQRLGEGLTSGVSVVIPRVDTRAPVRPPVQSTRVPQVPIRTPQLPVPVRPTTVSNTNVPIRRVALDTRSPSSGSERDEDEDERSQSELSEINYYDDNSQVSEDESGDIFDQDNDDE